MDEGVVRNPDCRKTSSVHGQKLETKVRIQVH